MSGEELSNPDFIVGGWRVDRDGNSYKLFRRQTTRAEQWHEDHRDVGVQYGRSIAVSKDNQVKVKAAIEKDGLVVRERTNFRERTEFVGDPSSCRTPI